jgi:manganese/zinc/iron transport system permease protein
MIDFFTDPILRGPTWGTFFMCIASSLMGVILLLKKRSLLGETLSHAAYPGIIAGVSLFALLFPSSKDFAIFGMLAGAFITSYLGFKAIEWMEKKGNVRTDAALCFILALFFGAGTVAASAMQHTLPSWKTQVGALMFGQAATLSDFHIALYAILTGAVVLFLFLSFRPLQAALFDADYATTSGLPVRFIEKASFWLLLFALILGVKSVGIVLISGMTIAPAIAARQFTDRLQTLFFLSALFGGLSGLIGNIVSTLSPIALPTGPSIILAGASIALLSLLFAPKRGLVFRMQRILAFRFRCVTENVLKAMWKKESFPHSSFSLWFLKQGGWIIRDKQQYALTSDGQRRAAAIVRAHRLWELYLASELGYAFEKVHMNAEEMEHILTPEMEERLTRLLSDPKVDPHLQPIPERISL